MIKVIYIAGPFRASSHWKQEQNIRRAESLALDVWKLGGTAVICPHANTRFFQGEAPDSIWLDGDLELVRRSDAVLMVTGWDVSPGATNELKIAQGLHIPVFFDIVGLHKWLIGVSDVQTGNS